MIFLQGGPQAFGAEAAEIVGRMYRTWTIIILCGHRASDTAMVKTIITMPNCSESSFNQDQPWLRLLFLLAFGESESFPTLTFWW